MNKAITRRSLIAGGLGLATGLAGLYFLKSATSLKNQAFSDTFKVAPDCLHAGIGKAYLKQTRPKPTAQSLHYTLQQRLTAPFACQSEALQSMLQTEYEAGQTAEVNGWVLPETLVLLNAYNALQKAG